MKEDGVKNLVQQLSYEVLSVRQPLYSEQITDYFVVTKWLHGMKVKMKNLIT